MDMTMGFNTFEKQDKILVGMSGGVDSSVTVRILQEQGFAVQGAVIRFSPPTTRRWTRPGTPAPRWGCRCM